MTTTGQRPQISPDPDENATARQAITDAYTAVEHALVLVDAACCTGVADEVDGYPDDAQRDLKRALRSIRAAERVFTPEDGAA